MADHVIRYTQEIMRQHPEIVIHEVNTDLDHIHMLVSIAPKLSIADAVKIIKANTARQMRKRFTFLSKAYYGTDGIWSIGYFVSTVGMNEKVIKKYIEQQGQEDSGQAQLVLR